MVTGSICIMAILITAAASTEDLGKQELITAVSACVRSVLTLLGYHCVIGSALPYMARECALHRLQMINVLIGYILVIVSCRSIVAQRGWIGLNWVKR